MVASRSREAVVGAPGHGGFEGAAYIFVRRDHRWTQDQELLPSDGVPNDQFGSSVTVDGNTMLVGAPSSNIGATGAAYVFIRRGDAWSQQQKLVQSDGTPQDGFGHSAAFRGGTAVLGAFTHKGSTGAAYVFVPYRGDCGGENEDDGASND